MEAPELIGDASGSERVACSDQIAAKATACICFVLASVRKRLMLQSEQEECSAGQSNASCSAVIENQQPGRTESFADTSMTTRNAVAGTEWQQVGLFRSYPGSC